MTSSVHLPHTISAVRQTEPGFVRRPSIADSSAMLHQLNFFLAVDPPPESYAKRLAAGHPVRSPGANCPPYSSPARFVPGQRSRRSWSRRAESREAVVTLLRTAAPDRRRCSLPSQYVSRPGSTALGPRPTRWSPAQLQRSGVILAILGLLVGSARRRDRRRLGLVALDRRVLDPTGPPPPDGRRRRSGQQRRGQAGAAIPSLRVLRLPVR